MMCSDYMAVHISVQCFQPQQKAESFQFYLCTFGDSYKTGLIHMDFSPLFWLSLFYGFPKSPAEFYCPEFLPIISQANRFRLFFQKCSPHTRPSWSKIYGHPQGNKNKTLKFTSIFFFFVIPNFDLLSPFDYLYFRTFQSPRQQFNIFCSEYITVICVRMEPEFITDICGKIQYSLCLIGNRLSLLSILTKICS